MSIKLKLAATFALVLACAAGVLAYADLAMLQASGSIQAIYDKPLMSSNYARDALSQYEKFRKADSEEGKKAALEALGESIAVVEERLVSKDSLKHVEKIKQMLQSAPQAGAADMETTIDLLVESEFSAAYDHVIALKSAVDQTRTMLLIAGGGMMVMVLGGAIFLFLSMTRPIRQCVLLSEAISRGKFDNKITLSGSSEFVALLRAFQRMQTELVAHLQESQAKLIEQKNAEKQVQQAQMLATLSQTLQQSTGSVTNVLLKHSDALKMEASSLSDMAAAANVCVVEAVKASSRELANSQSVASACDQLAAST
ncbi:MAG: HAMP domain-containing protein, partial [Alphaproteobacteria bacterium]|nr:HAMP domain-containing protein [Alphaproteobacteria bacterium]